MALEMEIVGALNFHKFRERFHVCRLIILLHVQVNVLKAGVAL